MRVHDYELLPDNNDGGSVVVRWHREGGAAHDVSICKDDLELILGGLHGCRMRMDFERIKKEVK